jgi:hypothetical protein
MTFAETVSEYHAIIIFVLSAFSILVSINLALSNHVMKIQDKLLDLYRRGSDD